MPTTARGDNDRGDPPEVSDSLSPATSCTAEPSSDDKALNGKDTSSQASPVKTPPVVYSKSSNFTDHFKFAPAHLRFQNSKTVDLLVSKFSNVNDGMPLPSHLQPAQESCPEILLASRSSTTLLETSRLEIPAINTLVPFEFKSFSPHSLPSSYHSHKYHTMNTKKRNYLNRSGPYDEIPNKVQELQSQLTMLVTQNVSCRKDLITTRQEREEAKENYELIRKKFKMFKHQFCKLKLLATDVKKEHDQLQKTGNGISQGISSIRLDIRTQAENIRNVSQDCQTISIRSTETMKTLSELKAATVGCEIAESHAAKLKQGISEIFEAKEHRYDGLIAQTNLVLEVLQTIQECVSKNRTDTEVIRTTCAAIEPFHKAVMNTIELVRSGRSDDHTSQISVLTKMEKSMEFLKSHVDQIRPIETQNEISSTKLRDQNSTSEMTTQDNATKQTSAELAASHALPQIISLINQTEELRAINAALQKDVTIKSDEIIKIQSELEDLQQKLSSQEIKLADRNKAERKLEAEAITLKQRHLDEVARLKRELDNTVNVRDKEISKSTLKLQDCQTVSSELSRKLNEKNKENEKLEMQVCEREKHLSSSNTEILKLNARIDALQQLLVLNSELSRSPNPKLRQDRTENSEIARNESNNVPIQFTQTTVGLSSIEPILEENKSIYINHFGLNDDSFPGLSQDIVLSMETASPNPQDESSGYETRLLSTPDLKSPVRQATPEAAEDIVIPHTPDDPFKDHPSSPVADSCAYSSPEQKPISSNKDKATSEVQSKLTRSAQRSPMPGVSKRRVAFIPETRPTTANHEMLLRSSDIVDFGTRIKVENDDVSSSLVAEMADFVTDLSLSPSKGHGNHSTDSSTKRQHIDEIAGQSSDVKRLRTTTSSLHSANRSIGTTARPGSLLNDRNAKGSRKKAFHGSKKHETHFGSDASKI